MSTNPSSESVRESYPSQRRQTAQLPLVADLDLWRRLKLGDEQAIADLYDRYSKLIYNVAYQVLRDPRASEDVLQEVLLQVWRAPYAFEPAKGSWRTWLIIVSRRRAIDRLRHRKAESDVDDLVLPVDATQLEDAALKQITDKVGALLEEMPEKLRVTFELAYLHGLTHAEISERLGTPLGTTKSRIRQALIFIRTKFNCKRPNTNAKGNGHVR
jgi:RNA polymerase sigma-70 factor (ECF subfamily)